MITHESVIGWFNAVLRRVVHLKQEGSPIFNGLNVYSELDPYSHGWVLRLWRLGYRRRTSRVTGFLHKGFVWYRHPALLPEWTTYPNNPVDTKVLPNVRELQTQEAIDEACEKVAEEFVAENLQAKKQRPGMFM